MSPITRTRLFYDIHRYYLKLHKCSTLIRKSTDWQDKRVSAFSQYCDNFHYSLQVFKFEYPILNIVLWPYLTMFEHTVLRIENQTRNYIRSL